MTKPEQSERETPSWLVIRQMEMKARMERRAQCVHDRLDEDGICRACGAEKRGAQ